MFSSYMWCLMGKVISSNAELHLYVQANLLLTVYQNAVSVEFGTTRAHKLSKAKRAYKGWKCEMSQATAPKAAPQQFT